MILQPSVEIYRFDRRNAQGSYAREGIGNRTAQRLAELAPVWAGYETDRTSITTRTLKRNDISNMEAKR